MKLVSVIVPVYNLKTLLPRYMDSLLAQTVQEYETILVDDGSTDGSSELYNQYMKEHLKIVSCIHKLNGGLSSARNAGMDVDQGEYVIFSNPDDWTEIDYLEHLLELQKQYSVDLVCTGHIIDYDDRSIRANHNQIL